MKGFVPVDVPTKPYIKAYVHKKLGAMPLMTREGNSIGHKLYDLLEHSLKDSDCKFNIRYYTATIRVYIPIRLYKNRGHHLNKENIKNFNLFIEEELKDKFHDKMDDLIDILPNFSSNLPEIRRRLGIDIEAWSDDSMKKDYYRYRKAAGQRLLYSKVS